MRPRTRLHTAVSALALGAMLSGCASVGGEGRNARVSDYRNKSVDTGLATRAIAALNANDVAGAIDLAQRAVARTPTDAGFRALLGNAYFAAGRFASAEQAFKDSLSLYADQPKVMLKLALVQIAQGRSNDALAFLDFARATLDPADYGLALALAGRPADAIPVLQQAAGSLRADARVRQNLALAYALAGDWVNARVVASQDVSPADIDQRIQGWMQFAGRTKPATQVATLVGVTPAAVDPGQPVQLALAKGETQMAAAAPVAAPQPVVAPPQPIAAPEPYYAPPPPPPPPVEMPTAASVPVEAPLLPAIEAVLPMAPQAPVALPTLALVEAAPAIASAAPTYDTPPPPPAPAQDFPYVEVKRHAKKAKVAPAAAPKVRAPIQHAVFRSGKSNAVVQLGAYGSSERVLAAWTAAARRYAALRNYSPMSARFVSASGPVYRLSVKGFASQSDASDLCSSIKRSGGKCFVRTVAGDRPMQIASR